MKTMSKYKNSVWNMKSVIDKLLYIINDFMWNCKITHLPGLKLEKGECYNEGEFVCFIYVWCNNNQDSNIELFKAMRNVWKSIDYINETQ